MTVLELIRNSVSGPVAPSYRLDTLGMDSLEFVELIREIEGEFCVVVPDVELANLQTVQDLENLVNRLQNSLVRG